MQNAWVKFASTQWIRAVPARLVFVGLVSLGLAWPGAALAQKSYDIKLAFCTINDPVHRSVDLLKERLEARTKGQFKVKTYPQCQLGKIPRLLENTQLGAIQFFPTPTGFAIGVNKNFQVPDVPGMFDSTAHAHKAMTHPIFFDKFKRIAEDKGLYILNIWVYGSTSYATLKPVRKIEDFKGRKIRVLATKTETTLMKRIGATGVPISFSEVLPALQRRTIDGVRSSIVVMGALKFFTVAKYITIVDDAYIPIATFASKRFVDKLPKDLQDAVFAAGKDVQDSMLKITQDFAARAEQLWKDNGAEIIRLSAEDQAEFMRRAVPVGDEFVGKQAATSEMYGLLKQAAAATK